MFFISINSVFDVGPKIKESLGRLICRKDVFVHYANLNMGLKFCYSVKSENLKSHIARSMYCT